MGTVLGQLERRRMAEPVCSVDKTCTLLHLLDVDIRITCGWLEPNILTSAALVTSVAGNANLNDVAWHKIPTKAMI